MKSAILSIEPLRCIQTTRVGQVDSNVHLGVDIPSDLPRSVSRSLTVDLHAEIIFIMSSYNLKRSLCPTLVSLPNVRGVRYSYQV
jgi:hypothetical protein